jgi:hypothetical protein
MVALGLFYARSWLVNYLIKLGFIKSWFFIYQRTTVLRDSIHTFWGLCIGMFVIMTIADMFRPQCCVL